MVVDVVVRVVLGVVGVSAKPQRSFRNPHPHHHSGGCSGAGHRDRRCGCRHGHFIRQQLGPLAVHRASALRVFVQVMVRMSHGTVAGARVLELFSAT